MKVAVVRFSSIGDIVLTTPVVRILKTQAEAEVHYVTKKQYGSIVLNNPYVDKVHVLDKSLGALVRQLRAEKFDYLIDLHHNLRTRLLSLRTGIPTLRFNKLNIEKWLLVNLKINRLPNVHIVDRYLETIQPLGVKVDALGLDYFIPEADHVPLEWLPETHHQGYVAYAIGAQHATKRLPLSRMIELCDKINKPIILLGGKEDQEAGEKIYQFFHRGSDTGDYEKGLMELGKKTVIYNACGLFNLNQSASLLQQARYVFAHDTGLMHIAAALKKEIFSIWGSTIPAFGMYPYRTRFTVLENTRLSCRPCSKIGHKSCPKGHFKCMNELPFEFYLP
jgi:ADP-heptose:LPS heptosyltransferase